MHEHALSEEEFEQVKRIERNLGVLTREPLKLELVAEPLLLLLSPPVFAPAQHGLSYECELLLANAGARALRVDRIATESQGLHVESLAPPFTLEAHSWPRRITLELYGSGAARHEAIPLKFFSGEEVVAEHMFTLAQSEESPASDLESETPFMEAIANDEIEIFPGLLDFGDAPFWGDENVHLFVGKAENLEVVGDIVASGRKSFTLDAREGEWNGIFAFADGKHRYHFKIDDCATLDPGAAGEIEINQEGIDSVRTVQHYTRFLQVRNVARGAKTLDFFSGQDWLAVSPNSLTLAGGESGEVAVKILHEKMPLGKFAGMLQITAESAVHELPVCGNLITRGKAAVIKKNLEQSVLDMGKCYAGKPLEIPFTVRTIGNASIRVFAFDDLSGYMQNFEVPVAESDQVQEADCMLSIPTESLLSEQRSFRLHVQTNCYLENLAGHTFEVSCEPVRLYPEPRVLEFVFAGREAKQLVFLKAYRSDGVKVRLEWVMSEGLEKSLQITAEGGNTLRIEARSLALPPEGELRGELLIEDVASGLIETIPCYVRLIKISHADARADSYSNEFQTP